MAKCAATATSITMSCAQENGGKVDNPSRHSQIANLSRAKLLPADSSAVSGDQFANSLVVFDEVLRTAIVVDQRRVPGVDTHVLIHGCENFVEVNRPIFGLLAQAIRRADDLPRRQSAAREEHAGGPRPVVAAGARIDARGAAEFAPQGNDR